MTYWEMLAGAVDPEVATCRRDKRGLYGMQIGQTPILSEADVYGKTVNASPDPIIVDGSFLASGKTVNRVDGYVKEVPTPPHPNISPSTVVRGSWPDPTET